MNQPSKIMVVDDQETNRTLLERALARKGHHPILMDSGMAALAYLQDQDVDLILLDQLYL